MNDVNYYRRQKSMHSDVFWITFDKNKIETCGFQRLIAKTQEHFFMSKIFSEEKVEDPLSRGSLKNHAGFLKTAIEVYWFFLHIWNQHRKLSRLIYISNLFMNFFFSSKNAVSVPLKERSKKWIQSKCRFYCLVICHFVLY